MRQPANDSSNPPASPLVSTPMSGRELPTCPDGVDAGEPDRLDRLVELGARRRSVVRFQDSRLLLEDLGHRPERDAFSVREHTSLAPGRQLGRSLDLGPQLLDQAALADPGNAHDRHQLHRLLGPAALERTQQQPAFCLAAHQRRRFAHGGRNSRARLERHPAGKRLRLALRHDRIVRLVDDHPLSRAERRLANEHAVDRRQPLQPRRRVHDVAGHDPLAELGPRSDRDQRFTRLHSHPHVELLIQLLISSRIASAARTARSASSSRAAGAPNTAIAASPMNFSTVPPKRSSTCRSLA